MSNVEGRLASLEARMDTMSEVRALIIEMRADMNRQFSETHGDTNRSMIEMRGDMNRQFADARDDSHRRFGDIHQRVQSLDEKEDSHFTWVIGIQVASILAVVGMLAGAYYR